MYNTTEYWNENYLGEKFEATYQGKYDNAPKLIVGRVVSARFPRGSVDVLVTLYTPDGYRSFYPSRAMNFEHIPNLFAPV